MVDTGSVGEVWAFIAPGKEGNSARSTSLRAASFGLRDGPSTALRAGRKGFHGAAEAASFAPLEDRLLSRAVMMRGVGGGGSYVLIPHPSAARTDGPRPLPCQSLLTKR